MALLKNLLSSKNCYSGDFKSGYGSIQQFLTMVQYFQQLEAGDDIFNTAKTRNNVLSAGSYSIASDDFNQRQSTDEDKRYYYTDPQTT